MPNYQPDLTGTAPANYIDTYQRMVWKAGQKLLFDVPVFDNDALEVIAVGGVPETLIAGIDYVINIDDTHDDAIGFCKTIDNEFTLTLVKSITITRAFVENYLIQCKFNQLFADDIRYTKLNTTSDTLEVTPALISNVVEQIDYLQQMTLNASDTYSSQSELAKMLEIDRTGVRPGNRVPGEHHDINTINGVSFVKPIYGAFYSDNLDVFNVLTGEILPPEAYRIHEPDLAKTRNSGNHHGVFRSIEILIEFVGQIGLNYQAYGGSTDVVSMNSLKDKMVVMETFLSENSFITPGTLHAETSIIKLYNKIADLEGNMRLLLQNGLPNYGDVSTNSSVLKKIVALNADKHWWTVATLYRVDGSNDNVTADVFKFRISTMYTGMLFECSVAVNVGGTYTGDRITVTCINDNVPHAVIDDIIPSLRILEVDTGGAYAGVVLQLGMKLGVGILQESIAIEDISGMESCWKLVPFTANSVNPEDTTVLMPDGVSTYTEGASGCTSKEAGIPFVHGADLLRADTNIGMTVTAYGAASEFNDDSDRVYQGIGEIDWSTIKGISVGMTLNVGGPGVELKLTLPVKFVAVGEHLVEFSSVAAIDGIETEFTVFLFYDNAHSSFMMRTIVRILDDVTTTNTFNLNSTKLAF